MPEEPALLAHLGVSESGKTYALQRCIRAEYGAGVRRWIVVDANREWPGACHVPRVADVADVAGARLALDAAERVILLQPAEGELADVGEQAASLALERGAVLVLPEAQLYVPEGTRLSGDWLRLATGWRHRGAGLWLDAQRPATISKTVLELCRRWRIFGLAGRNDLAWVSSLGGDELVEAVTECARRLAPASKGGREEPGWHVEIDPRTRIPPFEPVRFTR